MRNALAGLAVAQHDTEKTPILKEDLMIRALFSIKPGLCSFLTLACAALLLSSCAKKTTNVAPAEEPPAPRYRAEPAKPQPEQPKPMVREESSEATPLAFESIHFDYDKSDLTAAARDMLAHHASLLRNNSSVKILIEGHCDERGTIEYNLALGDRRAEAIVRYLSSLGVDRARLSTISYGKERPLELGHNESAWYKNRRAEFKIVGR